MEHRCSQRHQLNFSVQISTTRLDKLEGLATNISSEGIFVNVPEHLFPVNSLTKISFQTDEKAFHLTACVIHTNDRGVGLLFEHAINLNHALLSQLQAQHLADEQVLINKCA